MRNSENRPYPLGSEELKRLLTEAKTEERCARARAVSLRLEALAGGWSEGEAQDLTNWLEGLAAEAANLNREALQALRVAVTGA